MHYAKINPARRALVVLGVAAIVAIGATVRQQVTSAQDPGGKQVPAEKKHAKGLSEVFRAASEKILPAVVTIETRTKPQPIEQHRHGNGDMPQENPFKGTPFEDFFKENAPNGRFHGHGGRQSMPKREGTGSGTPKPCTQRQVGYLRATGIDGSRVERSDALGASGSTRPITKMVTGVGADQGIR